MQNVTLVLSKTGETVRHGRWGGRDTTLKSYDVVADDGSVLGVVAIEMATFERKTRGKTYVNSRWRSPRWFYYVGANQWLGRRSIDYTTRKSAVEALLRKIASATSEIERAA